MANNNLQNDNKKDLYSLVSEATQGNTNMNKVQLGYTVDSYKGVLSKLKQLYATIKKSKGEGPSGTTPTGAAGTHTSNKPVFSRWTPMGHISNVSMANYNGFIVNFDPKNPNEIYDVTELRQMYCVIKPFMSFIVNLKDEDNKEYTYFCGFDSHNATLNGGISSTHSGSTYPMTTMTADQCDGYGTSLGSMENPFEIGIGVDLTDTDGMVDRFFKNCYSKIYKNGIGAKLVSSKALLAEVAFITRKSPTTGDATTANVRVIANAKTPEGSIDAIYFPIPLLLTNTFDSLGKVVVKHGEDKEVGEGAGASCTSPLSTSTFNHLTASIEGFTPAALKRILQRNRTVAEARATFNTYQAADNNNNNQDICYVRFYLDSEKKQVIQQILGDIPSEYEKEIYKGLKKVEMNEKFVGWEESMSAYEDSSTVPEVYQFWNQVGSELGNVDGKKLIAAVDFIGNHESGKDGWGAWAICGKGDGDKQGVSAGRFQFTQRAGGIKVWLEKYLQRNGDISSSFQSAIRTSKSGAAITYSEAKPLLDHIKEWRTISSTKEGQLAQCDTWKQEKGPRTINMFKKLGCTTAGEFGALFGAINHFPDMVALINMFENDVKAVHGHERAVLIEKLHWAGTKNHMKNNSYPKGDKRRGRCIPFHKDCISNIESVKGIDSSFVRSLSKKFGKGWSRRYRESIVKWKDLS